MKNIVNGLGRGLLIQAGSVGPISMLLLGLSISPNVHNIWLAVLGITLCDFISTFLVSVSVSALQQAQKYQKVLDIISGALLIVFGALCLFPFVVDFWQVQSASNLFFVFFGFNAPNPISLIFLATIFRASCKNINIQSTLVFGLGFWLATPIFAAALILISKCCYGLITPIVIRYLNIILGYWLVFWGIKNICTAGKSAKK